MFQIDVFLFEGNENIMEDKIYVIKSSAALVNTTENQTQDKIQLKKEIGVLEGVAIIIGIILGSGDYNNFFDFNYVIVNKLFSHILQIWNYLS